jgi:predicted nucleic acid-binding protein
MLKARIPALTDQRVESFLRKFTSVAALVPNPPSVFALPRDPDDEAYTDLAIAAKARYLVTWNDRHLTYLMRRDTPEGKDFCQKFPTLTILAPPAFVQQFV